MAGVLIADGLRLLPGLAAQLAGGIGVTLLLGIYLTPQMLGVYTLYWITQSYLSTAASGWLRNAVIRYLSAERSLLVPYLRVTGRTAVLVIAVVGLGGLVAALVAVPPLDVWSIVWTGALVVGITLFATFQAVLRGLFEQRRFSASATLLALLKLALLAAALHWLAPTARNALAALALSHPLVLALQWERIRRFRGEALAASAREPSGDTDLWSRSLKFGLPLIVSSLVLGLLQTGDRYLLAGLVPLDALGIYAFWMTMAIRLGQALQQVLFATLNPRLFQLYGSDPQRARTFLRAFAGSYAMLAAPALILAGCWLPPILLWFGVKLAYASGAPLIFFGVAMAFLLGLGQLHGKPMEFRGHTLPYVVASVAALAVMATGVLLAAPRFGLYGAAAATTAGHVVYAAMVAAIGGTPARAVPLAVALSVSLGLLALFAWLGAVAGTGRALSVVTAVFLAYFTCLLLTRRAWQPHV